MLWRKTNFSFSAKSFTDHPIHSDLEDDAGTEEADPASVPADLIFSNPLNRTLQSARGYL